MAPDPPPPAPPRRVGPCQLVAVIAEGSMSTVWAARMCEARPYAAVGDPVAVKLLSAADASDPGRVQRLVAEGERGLRVSDDALARTHEVLRGVADAPAGVALVLEQVDGRTLRALMAELGPAPEALLRRLGRHVAEGLAALHGAGIVHRDLKPENILITAESRVKIVDLGLAREALERPSAPGPPSFEGTLLYAAPEQIEHDVVSPAGDLYALGVVLYEAATGVNPFHGHSNRGIARRHREVAPRPASELNAGVSPWFEGLLGRLLDKAPERRPASAAAVAGELAGGPPAQNPGAAHEPPDRVRVRRDAPFVGRGAQRDLLTRRLTELVAGMGGCVWIQGEAGIGKSRLLDQWLRADATRRAGFAVRVVEHRPDGDGGVGGALGRALKLAPDRDGGELAQRAARSGQALRALAAATPLVCILEDLHFASAAEQAVVAALPGMLTGAPVLLLATSEGPPPVADWMPGLALGRLTAAEVGELIRGALASEAAACALEQRAGAAGANPLLILEWLRAERETARFEDPVALAAAGASAKTIPITVRGLLESRLAALAPADRELLEVGAAMGYQFDTERIAVVLDQQPLAALERMARLESRTGLVRAHDAGFEFDPPLLREVVYQAMPEAERIQIHRALAASIAVTGPAALPMSAAEFQATHHIAGAEPEAAAEHAIAAIAALKARDQPGLAHDLARRMLDAEPRLDRELAIDLWIELSGSAEHLGLGEIRREAASTAVARAAALADPARLARARLALGEALASAGEHDAARAELEAAVASVGAGAGSGLRSIALRASQELARIAYSLGQFGDAAVAHEKALAIAVEQRDERAEGQAHGGLGNVAYSLGRYRDAEAHYHRYRSLASASGDRRGEARATGNLGSVFFDQGRYGEARQQYLDLLRIAVAIGDRRAEAFAISNLGETAHALGDLGAAREHFERFLAHNRLLGVAHEEATTRLSLGYVSLVEGKLEEAARHIDACERRARADGSQRLLADCWLMRGNLRRALGRGGDARADYQQAVRAHRAAGAESRLAEALYSLGRLLAEDDDEAGAALFLGESLRLTRKLGLSDPGPLPEAWLARLGLADPEGVVVPEEAAVVVQAEAHVVLSRAGRSESRSQAGVLLDRLSAHLCEAEREEFWRRNPTARAWRDQG